MNDVQAMERLGEARGQGLAAIETASSLEELRAAEVAALGRRSPVAEVQRSLVTIDLADRPRIGREVNRVFEDLRAAVSARRVALEAEAEADVALTDRIDVTLPGRRPPSGGLHPLTSTMRAVVDAFISLGYRVSEGPELETEWYNFDALNFPPDHPARLTQDTLYPDVPGGHEGDARSVGSGHVRARPARADLPRLLPVRGARCRSGRVVLPVRWPGLPGVRQWVDRAARRWDGPPRAVREHRDRSRTVLGLRRGPGDRARGDAAARRARHPDVLRGRRAVPVPAGSERVGVRVPLGWLGEFVTVALVPEDLAERMTMHGLPVDRIIRPWEGLSGVVVARVLEVRDHPGADRLCVARVDAGAEEREVVVGVRNMGSGDLVPYAPPGATLPGVDAPLERREIRGVASEGMLCSPKELGISGDHDRILVLEDAADPGSDAAATIGLGEVVLDIEVLANRADLLSILGVAREVAAMTGEDLRLPVMSASEAGPAPNGVTVEIADPDRCPRYLATVVRGVTAGSSPLRAQVRLTAAGMRPRWNVFDATNYAMLEFGQPLHAFDFDRLAGPGIVVRRASPGGGLVTPDDGGRERAGGGS